MRARTIGLLLAAACTDSGEPGPRWLSAPAEVGAGGWLWGVVDQPPVLVRVRVDGRPVALDRHVRLGATWRIPPLSEGDVDLQLGWPGEAPTEGRPLTLRAPRFVEVAGGVGLDLVHHTEGWPEECAESLTAIAVTDLDGDGRIDDLFVGNATADSVALIGDGAPGELPRWRDATTELGLGGLQAVSAASFADMDSDGDADLLVGRRGANVLLENRLVPDGEPGFVDVSDRLPPGEERRTMGAAWGDLDGDADLDLYLVNHHWCFPDPELGDPRSGDRLLRNDGDTFVELTDQLDDSTGAVSGRLGFTGLWLDHDEDGDLDLIVANDQVANRGGNVLWRNPGGAPGPPLVLATETGLDPGRDALGKGLNAMGVDVGDVDGDGSVDLVMSNIGPNLLFLRQGDGTWVESGGPAGVQRTVHPWGERQVTWATHMLDHDLDGDLDLWIVGGALKGLQPQPHALFDGHGDGTFSELSWTAGMASPGHGKASAVFDADDDGFLDVLVAQWGGPVELWHNRTADALDDVHHWLAVDLQGDGVQIARDAFGAVVRMETPDGRVQPCWRTPRPSLSATGDPACFFGLGSEDRVSSVEVTWPDGVVETVDVDGVDRRIVVVRGD